METVNILLSGLGGQGILFMTRILAQAALDKGFNMMGAETHGMAQRGGSVISHLRLGDVKSSLVRAGTAHLLLALEENEAYRNLSFLSRGARIYVNTDSDPSPREEIKDFLDKRAIIYRATPAATIARDLGAPLSSNLALLGYYSAYDEEPVNNEEIRKSIEKISPDRFKEINLNVFDAGLKRGTEERRE